MQVATVPVQICTGTVACAYNFLTIFSLSSLYLTLSSFSLSGAQLFLSSSHLINLSSSSFRWSPSLPSPPPPIAFSSFVSCCFRVEWAWSVGFGLNGVECLSPSPLPPLAFGGVDLVSRSRYHHWRRRSCCLRRGVDSGVITFWSILLKARCRFRCGFWSILLGLFFWFSAGGLCGFWCDTGVDCGCGSVAVWGKEMNILFE